MNRLRRIALALLRDFGGLIVFWIVMWRFGLKAAIAATILFVAVDGLRRLIQRERPPKLYVFTTALALIFGLIDLKARTPFMIRYEGAITNTLIGGLLAWDAFARKPMIQEFAEQSIGAPFPADRTGIRHYFRTWTLVWAGYGLLIAGFFLWTALSLPLSQALAVRALVGTSTSLGLLFVSMTFGRPIFELCRRLGLFRDQDPSRPVFVGAHEPEPKAL
jgi:intracellular septation protein A